MSAAMSIYGDSISGNCLKVKYIADRVGAPYRWIETSVMKKETRTSEFLALNPAGQVPLVILPDGRALAQSNAIMLYLAEGSDLIPADAVERAFMFQWLFWEQYSHETAIAVLRFHKFYLKKHDIDPALVPRCERVLTIMDEHLVTRRYFVGERLSLADVALVAYTRHSHEAGLDLTRWPQVRAWVVRIEQDLGLKTALPAA
jgi:glutathione S-transferase